MKPGGGKLSKRSNDAYVEHYINKGYFPEALNNFVALLGWSVPSGENEIITSMDELIDKVTRIDLYISYFFFTSFGY